MGSASGCHRKKSAYNRSIQTSPITQIPTPPRPPVHQPDKFTRQSDAHRYEAIWSERQRLSSSFNSSTKFQRETIEHHQEQSMDENWKKEFSTTNGSARVQSILEGNVHRCVNISTGEIDALIHKLSEIHNLVDQAIKERSQQISDETERVLSQIITDTQIEQQRLLSFAEQRQVIEDKLYREELQSFVKQLDERKARALAELQEELKKCREEIFEDSQTKVRRVNEQAQRVKQAILFEEQDKAEVQIQSILTQIQRASIDENLQHVGSESFSETLVTSQADVGTKAPGQNCKFTPVLTLNKKTSK